MSVNCFTLFNGAFIQFICRGFPVVLLNQKETK